MVVSCGSSLACLLTAAPVDYCTPDPCKNGGICSNQSSTYLCTCVPAEMWTGVNCTVGKHYLASGASFQYHNISIAISEIFKFEQVEIPVNPKVKDGFPEIFSNTSLTCEAKGIPEPNITWFKDGELLMGERSRTLVIREVDIADRGLYMCVAKNFNPNNQASFTAMSDEAVVNIKGKF